MSSMVVATIESKKDAVVLDGVMNGEPFRCRVAVKGKRVDWLEVPDGVVVVQDEYKPGCGGGRKKGNRTIDAMRRMARGGRGLLKAHLGVDRAGDETISWRRETCLNCPSDCYDFGVCVEERGGCGCYLAAKVRIKSEACPHGYWEDAPHG